MTAVDGVPLIVNLGCDLDRPPFRASARASPGSEWAVQWSSESVRYGGQGTPSLDLPEHCHFPGEAALLFRAVARRDGDDD
jgi:maltooligosyltrehalose trehalohydrolase